MKLFSLFEFIQPARSVLARASEFDSISIIPMIISLKVSPPACNSQHLNLDTQIMKQISIHNTK